jgi:hypothetical protein
MTLPQLPQTPQILVQSPFNRSPGQLTMYPQQMRGSEESIRSWLTEKTEEDKERQEEETIQESLRLEQRKVEQDVFRSPLSGSIPPHMEKAVISVEELTTLLRDSSLNLTEPTQQVYRPKDELSLVDIILLNNADRKITPVLSLNALGDVLDTSRSKVRLIHSVCNIDVGNGPRETSNQSSPNTMPPASQTGSPAKYGLYDQANTPCSRLSHLEYIRSISDHVSPTANPNGERLITLIYRSIAVGTVAKRAVIASIDPSELSPSPVPYGLRWLDQEWRSIESMILDLHITDNLIPCSFNSSQPVNTRELQWQLAHTSTLLYSSRGSFDFMGEIGRHGRRAAAHVDKVPVRQPDRNVSEGAVEIDKAVVLCRRRNRNKFGVLFKKPVDAVKALWLVLLLSPITYESKMGCTNA